jgi:hypothetical protein
MLNLLKANFKALGHCQIKLSYLLDNEFEGMSSEEQNKMQNQLNQGSESLWHSAGN